MQLLGEQEVNSERGFLALKAVAARSRATTDSDDCSPGLVMSKKPQNTGQSGSRRDETELAG